jgi:hypothetical protein
MHHFHIRQVYMTLTHGQFPVEELLQNHMNRRIKAFFHAKSNHWSTTGHLDPDNRSFAALPDLQSSLSPSMPFEKIMYMNLWPAFDLLMEFMINLSPYFFRVTL